MRILFNILAISGAAMFAGVLLAIGVILGGHWKSLPATDFLNSFSNTLQFIPRAISIVALATLVGVAGSIWLSWQEKDVRTLWLLAAVCIAVLLIFTAIWFGPTNTQFATKSLPINQVSSKLHTWLMLHNIRIALAAFASVLSIIATIR